MKELTSRIPVGFIGLGQMGKPMALNLLDESIDLTVLAKNHDAYAELKERGASIAESIENFQNKNIVFLSLPGTQAVRAVLMEKGGLAEILAPGSIVVDTSTIEHGATMEFHEYLRSRDIEFLDAPVSGMQSRAEDGTLTIMCGGDESTFDAVRPMLNRMGNNILHMGGPGSGQLTKLVNQLLFDINCAALAEILPMACRMGLDPEKAEKVVNSGTGRSYASEFFLPRVLNNHFSDGYPLNAAYKDLVSAAELGARHCIPMPVLAAATVTYQMAMLRGNSDLDKGAMVRLFEELLDVRFRAGELTELRHG